MGSAFSLLAPTHPQREEGLKANAQTFAFLSGKCSTRSGVPEAVGRRYTDGEATRNLVKQGRHFLRRSETAKELLPSGQLCDLSGLRLIHLSGPGLRFALPLAISFGAFDGLEVVVRNLNHPKPKPQIDSAHNVFVDTARLI